MERTCAKCGATSEADDGPLAECPKCGVIYVRAEEAQQAKRAAEDAMRRDQARRNLELAKAQRAGTSTAEPRRFLRIAETLSWCLTLIGGFVATGQMVLVHEGATSAPQQAAGSAMAVAWVVIPYCFARAVGELRRR